MHFCIDTAVCRFHKMDTLTLFRIPLKEPQSRISMRVLQPALHASPCVPKQDEFPREPCYQTLKGALACLLIR